MACSIGKIWGWTIGFRDDVGLKMEQTLQVSPSEKRDCWETGDQEFGDIHPISKRQSHVKNGRSGNCLVASASCKWMRLCIAISCQFCWFKPHVGLLNPGCLHKYLLYIYIHHISYIHYINGLVEGKCSRKPWFAPNIWPASSNQPHRCLEHHHLVQFTLW